MLNSITDFIKNKEFNIEETRYYKKVTPYFFTHDEISYHIDSLVSLTILLEDEKKEFIFYKDKQVETIGEELEVDLDDFIDFDTIDPAYTKSLAEIEKIKAALFKNS